LGKDRYAQLPKMRQLVILGLVLAGAAFFSGQSSVAVGIAAGMPISALNYYLMVSAVDGAAEAKKAQTFFLRRFLYRTVISFAALFLSLLVGVRFMLGVAVGLTLQVLVHILEGVSLILDRKG